MRLLREGTNRIWGAVMLSYVVAAIALIAYWMIADRGPVRWLGVWQAEHLFGGKWYPKLTAFVVLLGMLVPALIVKIAIEKLTGKRLTPPVRLR